MIEVAKVTEKWQLAGVYYVRTEGMCKGFNIPLDLEFSDDGEHRDYSILTVDGFPVGTCRINLLSEKLAKIERVCVLETHRGQNLGKKLIEETEKRLQAQGITKIEIHSRDKAVGFYEKLGYTADFDRVEQGFFPEVYMEKELN
jgi:ribosomal protein S18 acetylase RimI-like enzyme